MADIDLTIFWALQMLGYALVFFLPCHRRGDLVACCAISLMGLVFSSKVFSPQFIMWFTPFLLMQIRGRRYWIPYWLLQGSVYLEFPVFFHYYVFRPRFGWTWFVGGVGFYAFVAMHLACIVAISILLAYQARSK